MSIEVADDELERRIAQGLKDGTVRELKPVDPERLAEGVERRRMVDELRAYKPPPANWWTRSAVRAVLRYAIGLTDDVQKGELFERLVASNVGELTQLVAGLRTDLEATQIQLRAEVDEHAETKRRLMYYEYHNDSLKVTHSRLRRLDEIAAKERAVAERKAARAAMREELQSHTQFGELIDCRTCNGPGEIPDEKSKAKDAMKPCPTCSGSGVELNPDYVQLGEFKPLPKEKGDVADENEYKFPRPQLVADKDGAS